MVQRIFTVHRSATSPSGWELKDIGSGKILDMPDVCIAKLDNGEYMKNSQMIGKIETIQIALAGVTDSLNIVDDYSFRHRSVIKTFKLLKSDTIDDTIDGFLESVEEYEAYHTIYMDRDKVGDDGTIHAYIQTPNDGILRSRFDKSIRLNAKRNNIKYWVDDYKIETGSNGGKYVNPIVAPEEIM